MSNDPTNPPSPKVAAIVAAHEAAIDKMHSDLVALLPPGDSQKRADLDKAFEEYRRCHKEATKSIFLVMPSP